MMTLSVCLQSSPKSKCATHRMGLINPTKSELRIMYGNGKLYLSVTHKVLVKWKKKSILGRTSQTQLRCLKLIEINWYKTTKAAFLVVSL